MPHRKIANALVNERDFWTPEYANAPDDNAPVYRECTVDDVPDAALLRRDFLNVGHGAEHKSRSRSQ